MPPGMDGGCTRPPGGYRGPPGWGYTGGDPAVHARVGTGKAHALREAARQLERGDRHARKHHLREYCEGREPRGPAGHGGRHSVRRDTVEIFKNEYAFQVRLCNILESGPYNHTAYVDRIKRDHDYLWT